MFKRFGLFLAVVALAAPPLYAQETPTVAVRVRSLGGLLDDIKYLAELADLSDQVRKLEADLGGLFKAIDPKRPLGLFGVVTPGLTDSSALLMVPVADEKAFLDFLKSFGADLAKDQDDIWTVSVPPLPIPIYLRFANKYVYAAPQDKAALDKTKLPDPNKILPATMTDLLAVDLRIDQIPEMVRGILISQLDLRLPELLEQKTPGETEAQYALKVGFGKELARWITSLVKDGRDVALRLGLDRATQTVGGQFRLSAQPKSELATGIAGLGQEQSLFTDLPSAEAALSVRLNLALPESLAKLLVPALEEGLRKGLEEEKDVVKRDLLPKLFQALAPTLKAGKAQLGVSLVGPGAGQRFGFVGGAKVANGAALDKALRDMHRGLPAGAKALVKLDDTTVSGAKVHRIDADQSKLSQKVKATFGTGSTYLTVHQDAVFLAGGEGALAALQKAIALKPRVGPPVQVEVSVARFAAFDEEPARTKAMETAKKVFGGADKDSDKIRFTVEGGDALKIRFELKALVVKFFAQMN